MTKHNFVFWLLAIMIGLFGAWYFWLREPPHAKETKKEIINTVHDVNKSLGNLIDEISKPNIEFNEIYEQGLDAMKAQKWDVAIMYFKQATNNAKGSNLIYLFILIGSCYYGSNRLSEALENYNESVKLAEQFNNYEGMAIAYRQIGLCYLATSDFKNSLKYFNDSKNLFETLNSKEDVANNIGYIAYLYYTKNKINDALRVYNELLVFARDNGLKTNEADALYGIGIVYYRKNKLEVSIDYLNNALVLYKQINRQSAIVQTENEIKNIKQKIHKN